MSMIDKLIDLSLRLGDAFDGTNLLKTPVTQTANQGSLENRVRQIGASIKTVQKNGHHFRK